MTMSSAIESALRANLAEVHSKLTEAARIARASQACAEAGSMAEAIEVSMDLDQLIYDVVRLHDAVCALWKLERC